MTAPPYQAPPNGFRTFLLVWATQSVSVIGTSVAWFSLTVWLSQQYTSQEELGSRLAIIGLATAIPAIFLAPFAGAFVDRHDRRRTMLVADGFSGLLSLITMSLLATNHLTFPLLVIAQFLYQLFGAFHTSAFDTSYAMLVPEEQLSRANGMMQTTLSLSAIVAPGLAALLLALPTSFVGVMLVDAVSFAIGAVTLALVRIPSPQRADLAAESGGSRVRGYVFDMRHGLEFIWDRRPILWLLGTFAIYNVGVTSVQVLQPALVRFQLAANTEAIGMQFAGALALLQTVAGVGGVLGGIIISAWGGLRRKRVYGVLFPILVAGFLQTVYGLSTWVYVSAVVLFGWVLLEPIMNAHSQAIWQTHTPRELQGRVFAVRRLIAWTLNPVTTIVLGVLTARGVDAGAIIASLGAVTFVWCVANLFNPQLAQVDDKGYLEEYAARRNAVAET